MRNFQEIEALTQSV